MVENKIGQGGLLMKTEKWIFFDLGSTLIDESIQEKYIIDSIRSAFANFKMDYSSEQIRRLTEEACNAYKHPRKDVVRQLAKMDGQYEQVIKKAVYLSRLERLYPGTIDLLDDLSHHFKLGVSPINHPMFETGCGS